MTTLSRAGPKSFNARPSTSSLAPNEYMSAVSKKLMPASRACRIGAGWPLHRGPIRAICSTHTSWRRGKFATLSGRWRQGLRSPSFKFQYALAAVLHARTVSRGQNQGAICRQRAAVWVAGTATVTGGSFVPRRPQLDRAGSRALFTPVALRAIEAFSRAAVIADEYFFSHWNR